MPWVKTFTCAVPVGSALNWNWMRASSIYDPEVFTATAYSAHGHDTLSAFYNHYIVLGAKITVKFVHAGGVVPSVVGIVDADDTTTTNFPDRDAAMLNPRCTYAFLSAERPYATLTRFYSMKKHYAVGKRGELEANFGANPAENWFFGIWNSNLPGADGFALTASVRITYIVRAFERREIGPGGSVA